MFQGLGPEALDHLAQDKGTLEEILKYHIAVTPQTNNQLRNNEAVGTLQSDKKITIKEYFSVSIIFICNRMESFPNAYSFYNVGYERIAKFVSTLAQCQILTFAAVHPLAQSI